MFKINKEKNQKIKKSLKPLAGFLILLVFVQFSFAFFAQAAAPRFNINTPYVHNQTSGQDYFLLDGKNETKNSGWNFPISADPGDTLVFSVYYHNGVLNTVAQNTILKVNLPSGEAPYHILAASLWADNAENATPSSPMTQNLSVNLSSSAKLELVQGSVKWYPNQKDWRYDQPTTLPYGQTGNELFSSGLKIGDVTGCWEYSGYVIFKVTVKKDIINNPDLSINKTVRNITVGQSNYSESVNASQNDRVGFQIQIQNTGNSALNNVYVRDILPHGLSYVNGSTRVNGNYTSDGIVSGGINIGSLSVGSYATVIFEATVNTSSMYALVNTAYARADQVSEKNDSASIFTSQGPSGYLTISKYVRNVSAQYQTGLLVNSVSAQPGERVRFNIQITASSNAVNNVRSWDVLPSGLNFVSGSVQLDGGSVSDSFVSGGISLGTMSAYQTKNILFDAIVSQYVNNQTLTNWAYVTGDGVSQQQASAQVTVGQQTIISSPLTKAVENLSSPNGGSTDNNASVGDTLRYTVSYTNQSNAQLSNVQIIDVLPSYTSYLSVANGGYYNSSGNSINWNIGSLSAGASVSVSYQVKVMSVPSNGYIIANTALLKAQNISDVISNEVRTRVSVYIPPTPKPPITGANQTALNFLYSILISSVLMGGIYMAFKHSDYLRTLKLKLAVFKIRFRER